MKYASAKRKTQAKRAQTDPATRLREAVAELPLLDREVVLMRIFERLSWEKIAYVLGIEAPAAQRHLGRALLRLHKILPGQHRGRNRPSALS